MRQQPKYNIRDEVTIINKQHPYCGMSATVTGVTCCKMGIVYDIKVQYDEGWFANISINEESLTSLCCPVEKVMSKITADIIEYLTEKFYFHQVSNPEDTFHECSMITIDDLTDGLDEFFSRKEEE